MADYFLPDRSNRPGDIIEGHGQAKELLRGVELVGELEDGRPFVMELTAVDGYPVHFFYFDTWGLEHSLVEELRNLIERSIDRSLFPAIPGTEVACEATKCLDAQGRPVWEFVAIWLQMEEGSPFRSVPSNP